jgi:hypothetical protein
MGLLTDGLINEKASGPTETPTQIIRIYKFILPQMGKRRK